MKANESENDSIGHKTPLSRLDFDVCYQEVPNLEKKAGK